MQIEITMNPFCVDTIAADLADTRADYGATGDFFTEVNDEGETTLFVQSHGGPAAVVLVPDTLPEVRFHVDPPRNGAGYVLVFNDHDCCGEYATEAAAISDALLILSNGFIPNA